MSPEQVATIRNLRGCGVPWPVIAEQLGASVEDCRRAINMPEISNTQSEPAPWRSRQGDLFSKSKE